jgi:hypothetical protein
MDSLESTYRKIVDRIGEYKKSDRLEDRITGILMEFEFMGIQRKHLEGESKIAAEKIVKLLEEHNPLVEA